MLKNNSLFLLLFFSIHLLKASDYYCDPINGSMANVGSVDAPWSSLHDVFAAGKTFEAGDIIYLRTGNHGFAVIDGINADYVKIKEEEGHNAVIERIRFGNTGAAYWEMDGLTIRSENPGGFALNLIDLYPNASFITVKNCKINSIEDASNWTRDNWRDKANTGIRAQGSNHLILNNEIKNVFIGASIESPNTIFEDNLIQNFTIDGLRGLANYCRYENNRILDCMVVYLNTENHYDGFQSYTCCPVGSDTIFGVEIKRNIIISSTDESREFQGAMQGIGCFDGMFADWEIENNLVITDHWHGISLYGAINCKIINNTVVDPYDSAVGPAWIKIDTHKTDGTVNSGALSTGNIIRNNIVNQLANADDIGEVDHNEIIEGGDDYENYFVAHQDLDYHLMPMAAAIDNGSAEQAPVVDIENNPRPEGEEIDIGAYEYSMPDAINTLSTDANLFKISPNPVSKWLMIKVPSPTGLRIIDMKGQMVYSDNNFETQNIDIEQIGGVGIYWILFINDGKYIVKKLIVL